MKIITIIGTRPQYVKHAPLNTYISNCTNIELITIDTGQHYDNEMSKVFIQELGINSIKYNLKIQSSLHGDQTAKMLIGIEKILIDEAPEHVIVYGDTNSTLAGSLAAVKLKIPITHVEAGMRNFNLTVPEEINRVITDRVASLRIAPSKIAMNNLTKEGLEKGSYLLGDITTDLLMSMQKDIKEVNNRFYYVTVHRPYNTSQKERLLELLKQLDLLNLPVVFPLHPRTKNMMKEWGIIKESYTNITFKKPLGFHESTRHVIQSECVITDSGGVQKEAYILKKRCVTILPNTPWEETLIGNWNQLVFNDLSQIKKCLRITPDNLLYKENYFGDGNISKKIVNLIIEWKEKTK